MTGGRFEPEPITDAELEADDRRRESTLDPAEIIRRARAFTGWLNAYDPHEPHPEDDYR